MATARVHLRLRAPRRRRIRRERTGSAVQQITIRAREDGARSAGTASEKARLHAAVTLGGLEREAAAGGCSSERRTGSAGVPCPCRDDTSILAAATDDVQVA